MSCGRRWKATDSPRAEAERIIIPVSQGALPLGAQPKTVQVSPADIDATVAQAQVTALAGKARIDRPAAQSPCLSRSTRLKRKNWPVA